jgi:hypothetical protein
MSMTLPSCPLCRKPFVGSRIVKLHVDRPAASEQGVEDVELLQRLDAEEAKRQVELEAAVEQSKQRKRTLRESLERARQLRKQREEEAEIRKPQPPTLAGKSASAFAADSSPREIQIDEFLRIFNGPSATVPRTVGAAALPSTRWGRGEGGGWRGRQDANPDLTSSLAPPSTLWGRREGGGWRARTDADPTSSLASSTRAPMHVNTFFTLFSDFEDGNGSP